MSCRPALIEEFEERLDNTRFANIRQRVIQKMAILLEHPLANKTYFLHGDLAGKRAFSVSKNVRIIYAYCKRCRQENHVQLNNCHDCSNRADETVVFFTFDYHDKVYLT